MAKRTPLSFDMSKLTDDLKQPKTQGVDVLFSQPKKTTKKQPAKKRSYSRLLESGRTSTTEKKGASESKAGQIKKTRYLDRNLEKYLDIKNSRFLEFATPYLDVKPTDQQNFNYPPGAIEELEKIVLDLKAKLRKTNRRPRWSATKTTIYILAVLFILWDYKENGEDSILHKAIFG